MRQKPLWKATMKCLEHTAPHLEANAAPTLEVPGYAGAAADTQRNPLKLFTAAIAAS
jgi:hypothetical protein